MTSYYIWVEWKRHFEGLGRYGWILNSAILAAFAAVGWLFWFSGTNGLMGQLSPLSILVFFFFIFGLWTGLHQVSVNRPTTYRFIGRNSWLWQGLARGAISWALFVLAIPGAYYLSIYVLGDNSWTLNVLDGAVIVAGFFAVSLLGAATALVVRRIISSALARSALILLIGYGVLTLCLNYYAGLSTLEGQLFVQPSSDLLLAALLTFAGAIATITVIIELLFTTFSLQSHSKAHFWPAFTKIKLFRYTGRPFTEALIANWLYYLRSAAFQRRLLVLFLLFIFFPVIVILLGTSDGVLLAGVALLFCWAISFVISIGAGKQAFRDRQFYSRVPRSGQAQPWSSMIASGLAVIIVAWLFTLTSAISFTAATTLLLLILTLCFHLVLFYGGHLTQLAESLEIGGERDSDRFHVFGIAASLVLIFLAASFLKSGNSLTTISVAIIWTALTVVYFLNNEREIIRTN